MFRLETERLILREWQQSDREPFAAMNADPEVRRFFGSTQTRAQSDASVDRHIESMARNRFGMWAAEEKASGEFAGLVGLGPLNFDAPFACHAQMGWRFAPKFWNRGYATEGARRALTYAFEELRLPEVVAYTAALNTPSRRVMEKLGLTHDPADDFDYPEFEAGSPLRRHVLYRLRNARV